MCGIDRRVDELTYAELKELRLLNTDQRIPLLTEVLDVLDGATLLCEFKAMRSYTDTSLCEAALPLLNGYKGAVCIESFNPFMVRWFRKHAPQYIRGILSKKFEKGDVAPVLRFPLSSLFATFLCRPDFIAYQHTDHTQPFFRLCCLFKPMTVAWTVQSAADAETAKQHFDTIIFEGFLPTEAP
jgi:glycerophosphoryl diester phosphodiesterase